jgi:hypothetical protein
MRHSINYKVGLILFAVLGFAGLVSAVPQVIFSSLNLTIDNNGYHLWGEGLEARDTFPNNQIINYEKYNIPITFSREIYPNSTDSAILMNAIATNLNMTYKWQDCMNQLIDMDINLSLCIQDKGYRGNYLDCQNSLSICNANLNTANAAVEELKTVKSQRMVLILVCIGLAFAAWTYYNKANVKKVESPYKQFPSEAKL